MRGLSLGVADASAKTCFHRMTCKGALLKVCFICHCAVLQLEHLLVASFDLLCIPDSLGRRVARGLGDLM